MVAWEVACLELYPQSAPQHLEGSDKNFHGSNIMCTHFSVLMSEDNITNMLVKSLAFYKALMSNTFIGNANVHSKKKIRSVDVAFSSMFIFSILHAFYLLCSCLPPYYSLLPFLPTDFLLPSDEHVAGLQRIIFSFMVEKAITTCEKVLYDYKEVITLSIGSLCI